MSEDPAQGHTSVDLAALAAEAVVMLEAQAEERHIQIGFDATRSLPANGEERAVIQILVNLIGNAVRSLAERRAGPAVSSSRNRGNGVALTVADQGPGIEPRGPAADLRTLRTRRRRGPAAPASASHISRRLARSMGGDVTVGERAGQGARFTLTLPSA